jgi:hypothetical protein
MRAVSTTGDNMNETLYGVIIGGIIASITPIAQLIMNRIQWKKEEKLVY